MKQLRHSIIRAGLGALSLTGAHHLLRPMLAGIGTIFMLHHVRPRRSDAFQPNHHLEITPDFLAITLRHLRGEGIELISMDDMVVRLASGDRARRFACFTCDDGYRDNRDHALPVLREFGAPVTVYVASDFAEGRGRLWWVALERIIAKADAIEIALGGIMTRLDCATIEAKQAAFDRMHDRLRDMSDAELRHAITSLCRQHGIDEDAISRDLCMDWDELRGFAADPLVTIGAHTISHCNLATQTEAQAEHELRVSRARIEEALQKPAVHLAYPYGDKAAAGPREFALAKRLGFKTAVTTRPGMIFRENAAHMTALPRLSLNGNYQDKRFLPVLTSGAATAMYNGFRRNAVA
ncbi:MAG: polysaccharide deacetylase [Tardiphaga sp.]|nr:polysaccharide deacetylase [Tardiphaga sp.]